MDYLPSLELKKRLRRLRKNDLKDRLAALHGLSTIRGLRYLDDRSRPVTIDLALFPWILTRRQLGFFNDVARLMIDALLRTCQLYRESPEARGILPFEPLQEEWMSLASIPNPASLSLIGRLDSNATFDHARWQSSFSMLEPNAVGVGGVHYAPAGASVLLDVLDDVLHDLAPGHRIVPSPDPRHLLINEVALSARKIGKRPNRIALLENSDYTTGTDEFNPLAHYLNRHGLPTVVADPRELSLNAGKIFAKGEPVDLVYRDCELSEFVEIEQKGNKLSALRSVIKQGRLISGLIWEFDLKSTWEIFTDPKWSHCFTRAQRSFFKKHLPWTRLLRHEHASDPKGKIVDLVKYAREHKNGLLLKPNTLYGGQGIVVGRVSSTEAWEKELKKAIEGDMPFIVQEAVPLHKERFWHNEKTGIKEIERHVVSGFFCNSRDIGLVGRFSSDPVVNVSRGGGLLCALLVE
jgi:hypothetical protein